MNLWQKGEGGVAVQVYLATDQVEIGLWWTLQLILNRTVINLQLIDRNRRDLIEERDKVKRNVYFAFADCYGQVEFGWNLNISI